MLALLGAGQGEGGVGAALVGDGDGGICAAMRFAYVNNPNTVATLRERRLRRWRF